MLYNSFLNELKSIKTHSEIILKNKYKQRQYLSYKIGNKNYSIEIDDLKEVISLKYIIESPDAPGYICGVIPYKKGFINAVDLRKMLNEKQEFNNTTTVIIMSVNNNMIGLIVDDVSGISNNIGNYFNIYKMLNKNRMAEIAKR